MRANRFPEHLFLVGCGNMAGPMLARWLECGLDPARVTVYRPSGKSVADGVAVLDAWPEYLPDGTLVLLGMKPYQIDDVAPHVAGMKGQDIRLVSILAGISTAALRSRFPGHADIVCDMPNTPVGVGQGVCPLPVGWGCWTHDLNIFPSARSSCWA